MRPGALVGRITSLRLLPAGYLLHSDSNSTSPLHCESRPIFFYQTSLFQVPLFRLPSSTMIQRSELLINGDKIANTTGDLNMATAEAAQTPSCPSGVQASTSDSWVCKVVPPLSVEISLTFLIG